jgi:pre-rRNA-processing protein TSR2
MDKVHPNKRNFIEGLGIIFSRWPALRMAVDMEWGGHDTVEKAQRFQDSLIDYFDRGTFTHRPAWYSVEGKNIEQEDIEDILLDVLCDEFCTMLEDGSEIEIAKTIWTLYQESIKGKTTLLETLRVRATRSLPVNIVKTATEDESSEEDGEGGDDDAMEEWIKCIGLFAHRVLSVSI